MSHSIVQVQEPEQHEENEDGREPHARTAASPKLLPDRAHQAAIEHQGDRAVAEQRPRTDEDHPAAEEDCNEDEDKDGDSGSGDE